MSGPRKVLHGLTAPLKERLIQDALQRRLRNVEQAHSAPAPQRSMSSAALRADSIPESWCRFDQHPDYQQLRILNEGAEKLGVANPFFRVHDGPAGAATVIEGETYDNFSSYNYLGLCGHPQVNAAATAAIERYGTSASASRLVSGERPIHRELERALADVHGVEDCVVFVSGHATNVSTIGHLFGPVTVHFMSPQFDAGRILAQQPVVPRAGASVLELTALLYQAGEDLLARSLERVAAGDRGTAQSAPGTYQSWPTAAETAALRRRGGALLRVREVVRMTRARDWGADPGPGPLA